MAGMCGKVTLAEIEELVEVDAIHPDDVHLPGVFVDSIVMSAGKAPARDEPAAATTRKAS